jgi:prolipoprotein diacylglyceryltransferase
VLLSFGYFYHYYCDKSFEKNPLWLLDRLAITVALAGFFIRMGNFFNSEIVGKPAPDSPFAVLFPQQSMNTEK